MGRCFLSLVRFDTRVEGRLVVIQLMQMNNVSNQSRDHAHSEYVLYVQGVGRKEPS